MKSRLNALVLIVVTSITFLAGCKADSTAAADSTAMQRVERGRYLVTAIGCNDCHTPLKMTARGPEPDMARMLSGHPSSLEMPRRNWARDRGFGPAQQQIWRLPVHGASLCRRAPEC
jgi:hypothetical protein